jgi:hypothetical protein
VEQYISLKRGRYRLTEDKLSAAAVQAVERLRLKYARVTPRLHNDSSCGDELTPWFRNAQNGPSPSTVARAEGCTSTPRACGLHSSSVAPRQTKSPSNAVLQLSSPASLSSTQIAARGARSLSSKPLLPGINHGP